MARPHAVAEEESFLFLKYTSTYLLRPFQGSELHQVVMMHSVGDDFSTEIFNREQRLLLSPVHFQLSMAHKCVLFIYLFISLFLLLM
jgi:hypothetical protein